MNKIGIVVAMDTEFQLVKQLMENREDFEFAGGKFIRGNVGDKLVILGRSGIGKVFSSVGVVEMIKNFSPDCIINTGVAGGIDESLVSMDVVVGKNTVYHDVWCGDGNAYGQIQGMPSMFEGDTTLYEAAMKLNSDVNIAGGLICSGDKFITDGEVLKGIKEHFPEGMAVDMESCSMAQVCYIYKVPFLSFRIISDTPGRHDDNFGQYLNFFEVAPEKSFKLLSQLINNI